MIKYEVLGGRAGTSDYCVLGPSPAYSPVGWLPITSSLLSQSLPIHLITVLSLTYVCLLATYHCSEFNLCFQLKALCLANEFFSTVFLLLGCLRFLSGSAVFCTQSLSSLLSCWLPISLCISLSCVCLRTPEGGHESNSLSIASMFLTLGRLSESTCP